MRKAILSIGVVALLASCANKTTKTEVSTTDSTSVSVPVDSTHTSVEETKVESTSVPVDSTHTSVEKTKVESTSEK